MFGDDDMSTYPDILLWREYNKGLGITNHLEVIVQGGYDVTRSLVDCFLMEDGRPIYNSSIPYDDQTIAKARSNRDPRLIAFMKQPGQINYLLMKIILPIMPAKMKPILRLMLAMEQ